ncbi:hypothetical protein GY45DRAFT_820547 [Cubamyces sp. BRFM 1775]|nr:hypothetical protein GY45DRAFT_820547 [Cubamyces sp. BRFM 1775]
MFLFTKGHLQNAVWTLYYPISGVIILGAVLYHSPCVYADEMTRGPLDCEFPHISPLTCPSFFKLQALNFDASRMNAGSHSSLPVCLSCRIIEGILWNERDKVDPKFNPAHGCGSGRTPLGRPMERILVSEGRQHFV